MAKRGDAWVLKYIKSAQGETDVPDTIAEFISQRRRWLNGSFFASTYALRHTLQLRNTSHSRKRVFVLYLQALYNTIHLIFAWLAMGNFWIFMMVRALPSSPFEPLANLSLYHRSSLRRSRIPPSRSSTSTSPIPSFSQSTRARSSPVSCCRWGIDRKRLGGPTWS